MVNAQACQGPLTLPVGHRPAPEPLELETTPLSQVCALLPRGFPDGRHGLSIPQQVGAHTGLFPRWLSPQAPLPPQHYVHSLVTAWPRMVRKGQVTRGKGRARGDWGTAGRSMTKIL